MILSMTPAEALALIGSPQEVIREDTIIPMAFPETSHTLYQPEYDWLFQYERKIAAFLEKWLRPYRYELIGQKGILCEALSNAFYHGHHKDPAKAIALRVLLGSEGLLIEIRDQGSGFDTREVYAGFQNKKPYYNSAGNGIRLMAASRRFGIFHHAGGTTFHMLYLFRKNLQDLPSHHLLISSSPGKP